MNKSLLKQLAQLPNTPGVYLFRGADKQILYIGKASSIKKRVQSYFREKALLLPRLNQMVSQIQKIEFIETGSEIGALLLESELIKKQKPKYNVELKDDKNFLYIEIGGKGKGKKQKSAEREFPRVAAVRKPTPSSIQYFGPFTDAKAVRKTLQFVRRIFPYRTCQHMPQKPCLWYYLERCPAPCAGKISQKEYQKILRQLILFFQSKIEKIVKQLKKEMEAAATKKEYEKAAVIRDRLIALEHINQVNILQKEQERQFQNPLTTLVRLLSRYYPTLRLHPGFRIEAYDISHFGGSATTGSMIVFQNGEKEPSEYRMFKIKTSPQSDDIAAMTEVLSRRLQHREWIMPDLILIDGGKGQLKAGFLVQEKFLLNIPYLALAKKEEKIYLPGRSNPLQLEEDSPALLLLREIRDEAHRFAKQYHLKLRSKQFLKPSLKPILKR